VGCDPCAPSSVGLAFVITGFNTDIEFEGTTYHVQTEDKGLKTPLILSLVYVGGTIIASKRTPYKDLIETGFDEKTLTERLQRQHKLICAAIKAGRVADLKRMSGGAGANGVAAKADAATAEVAPYAPEAAAPEPAGVNPAQASPEEAASPPPAGAAGGVGAAAEPAVHDELLDLYEGEIAVLEEPLQMSLLDEEGDLRAGELATLKIHVGRGAGGQNHAAAAAVTVKILGTTFRPLTLSTKTDSEGRAEVRVLLPRFTSGRAAIIVRATADGESTELRRIIHHY
jgi:hypothetical protein